MSDARPADGRPAEAPAARPVKIFINYRHEDTQYPAWTLYTQLKGRFGAENVFFDHGTLQPGMRWLDEIESHLADSGAFIALIGPKWMSSLTGHLRRGGEDYVATEIDLALRGPRVTVIPVLVDEAELPDSRELPASLKALPGCQEARLRVTHLLDDIENLMALLAEVPVPEPVDPLPPLPPPRPHPRHAERPERPERPDEDHYREIARNAGNLVVFLGAGANADDHDERWSAGCGTLPDDRELAKYLATDAGLTGVPPHLAEAAQYARVMHSEMDLFQWVKQALPIDSEPGPVHRNLARLPARLGRRCQMIVTPKYDAALEKAFQEAGEEFDVAVYMAPGTEEAGRFVHLPWKDDSRTIDKPNEYTEFPIVAADRSLQRTVIVRINGAVDDPSAGFRWEGNYVITEDHYIDYLSGRPAEEVVPAQILAKLRKANCLFLGYTIEDWRLRVFLQRIWKGPGLVGRGKYWAVEHEPDALEKKFWQREGVDLYPCSLTDYLEGLFEFLDAHPGEAQP